MVNWYYVDGTERVGPIDVIHLEELFRTEKINLETYIWRKGFANWERLKNVDELDFTSPLNKIKTLPEEVGSLNAQSEEVIEELVAEAKSTNFDFELRSEILKDTPKTIESFSFSHLKEDDSLFFIKIGNDRGLQSFDYFGPYTTEELHFAYKQKRISEKTLVFALGFDDWQAIGAIPYFNKTLTVDKFSLPINTKSPLYFVYEKDNVTKIFLVKAITKNSAKLLCNENCEINQEIRASLFKANRLLRQNINLKVESFDKKSQSVNVKIIDTDDEIKEAVKDFNE